MSLLGGEGKKGDTVDIKMFRALGASNSLGEKVHSKYSVGWLAGYHLGSGARNDYREMKLISSSDLEAISEVRTLSACLIVMSGFIACGQRLLHNTRDKAQGQQASQSKCESLPEERHRRASYIDGISCLIDLSTN